MIWVTSSRREAQEDVVERRRRPRHRPGQFARLGRLEQVGGDPALGPWRRGSGRTPVGGSRWAGTVPATAKRRLAPLDGVVEEVACPSSPAGSAPAASRRAGRRPGWPRRSRRRRGTARAWGPPWSRRRSTRPCSTAGPACRPARAEDRQDHEDDQGDAVDQEQDGAQPHGGPSSGGSPAWASDAARALGLLAGGVRCRWPGPGRRVPVLIVTAVAVDLDGELVETPGGGATLLLADPVVLGAVAGALEPLRRLAPRHPAAEVDALLEEGDEARLPARAAPIRVHRLGPGQRRLRDRD